MTAPPNSVPSPEIYISDEQYAGFLGLTAQRDAQRERADAAEAHLLEAEKRAKSAEEWANTLEEERDFARKCRDDNRDWALEAEKVIEAARDYRDWIDRLWSEEEYDDIIVNLREALDAYDQTRE